VLLVFALVLGLQFIAARWINHSDPATPASILQSIHAWWTEVVVVARVFFWRQAFFANRIPDNLGAAGSRGVRGVVFVHGFVCNRGLWTPWLARLADQRRAFVAVSLEPVLGSIDAYVTAINLAVVAVEGATGLAPLIVCHSMGGLAVRAWLRSNPKNRQRIHHVVTIGTPHHGTWLGKFALSENGRQMQVGSSWITRLERQEPADAGRLFTCFYSNCDNIVFPTSTATLAGANNRMIDGQAHLAMAFHPGVINGSLALL
jgi:triacylglycerol esterase/lipase EstA (alpha/beta hydrolase family)